MAQKTNLASFTFTELFKDLNHDKIFLFILSYEYCLNYNQVLTLYDFSPEIFWSYINILKPALKLGDRKALMLKKSANNIYFTLLGSKVALTEKEREYLTYLSQYINDSFTNGDRCFHFRQINDFPVVAKGYFVNSTDCSDLSTIKLNSTQELFKYIDSIECIEYNGEIYTKTSRLQYMLDKYYADIPVNEIRIKSVKEIIQMLNAEAIQDHYRYLEELEERKIEARRERVYGKKEEILHQEA